MNIVSQKQKIMTVEEKAKRYAQSVVDESVENYMGDEIYNSHIEYASQCYTSGYTQAVTDINAENEKLRDVLRELVSAVNQEWFDAVWEGAVLEKTVKAFEKAKQLITEEK